MSLLKHSAMHPLTPGFAEAYAHEMKGIGKAGTSFRIREGITAGEFQAALSPIGINSPKDLAELLGCNVASAQGAGGYYSNPERINRAAEAKYYLDRLNSAYFCAEDECYDVDYETGEREVCDEDRLEELYSAYRVVFSDTPFDRALKDEYRRRALLEGFDALTDKQQDALLDHLRVMLQDIGEPREQRGMLDPYRDKSEWSVAAQDVAASLRRTMNGERNMFMIGELALLVRDSGVTDEQAINQADVYGTRPTLDEYAGLS